MQCSRRIRLSLRRIRRSARSCSPRTARFSAPARTSRRKPALGVDDGRLCPRQPADPRRVLLHPGQLEASDRRRAGRRARRRLRARCLLRHDLRRRNGRLRLAGDRRRPGRWRKLHATHPAALQGPAHDADRRARSRVRNSIASGRSKLVFRTAELLPAALAMADHDRREGPVAVRRIRGAFSTVEALERARGLSRRAGLHHRTQPLARRRGRPSGLLRTSARRPKA